MYTMLDDIFMTMSTSTGLYPKLDLWAANKLQLQLLYWVWLCFNRNVPFLEGLC